jgi:hypothetical protein
LRGNEDARSVGPDEAAGRRSLARAAHSPVVSTMRPARSVACRTSRGMSAASGKALPVGARHLLRHRGDVEPRRIEDARVVREPQRLDRVVARERGRVVVEVEQRERALVPPCPAVGRHDRPVHRGEPLDEERCRARQHVVLGLEPREVARAVGRRELAESHERGHLVRRAVDGLREPRERHDVVVRRIVEHVTLAVHDAPQQPVHARQARRVAVARGALEEVDDTARNAGDRRIAPLARRSHRSEQARVVPARVLGPNARGEPRARSRTEALIRRRADAQNNPSCSLGALEAPGAPVGRQSSATTNARALPTSQRSLTRSS